MATSPTQLTLRKWRKAGYTCAVVEKWNSHTKIRQDLYGFIDILAVGGPDNETVGIQSTTYKNVSSRIRKIEDTEELQPALAALRKANWKILVEGWRKPKHRWECREVDLS